ncbi:MAG: hypothetical protein H6Q12_828, partial [Bacteroidetes bacterium]|nr:hypothetical protein [Bacteroidota bacterium]
NMGSGFSIKSNTSIEFKKYGNFELNLQYYRIFTWKGYDGINLDELTNEERLYLNAQGDKGNVQLAVINPMMDIDLGYRVKISAGLYYYLRNTHYTSKPDFLFHTIETRLGLKYTF